MAGKITCTACGKVWQTAEEFQADDVKCGKDFCVQKTELSKEDRLKLIGTLARRRQKRLNIRVETFKVEYKRIDEDRMQLYYDVPQVIMTYSNMY